MSGLFHLMAAMSDVCLPADSVLPDFDGGGIHGLANSLANWLAAPGQAPAFLLDRDNPPQRSIVLIVIDGLGDGFLQRHGQGSHLLRYRRRRLTSVFPSTTASAVTTLMTGLSPAEHGLNGWYIHDQRFGGVILPLPLQLRAGGPLRAPFLTWRLFPYRCMFAQSQLPTSFVSPTEIAFSPFSRRHARGALIRGYDGLDGFRQQICAAVAAQGARDFVHAYYARFDAMSHHFGPDAPEVIEEFWRIDRCLGAVFDELSGLGTEVWLTADHGFIDASESRHVHLEDHPELATMLNGPLFGERRAAFCKAREGAEDELLAYVSSRLAGKAVAAASPSLLEAGLFGPGKQHKRLPERLGSHAILMEPGWTLSDCLPGEKEHAMKGVHGGLSADEMWVPLVQLRP